MDNPESDPLLDIPTSWEAIVRRIEKLPISPEDRRAVREWYEGFKRERGEREGVEETPGGLEVRGQPTCRSETFDSALKVTCERLDKLVVQRDEEVTEEPRPKMYSTVIPSLSMGCLKDLDVKLQQCGLKPTGTSRIAGLYACRLREERERAAMPRAALSTALKIPAASAGVQRDRLLKRGLLEKTERTTELDEAQYILSPQAAKALELRRPPSGLTCEETAAWQQVVRKGLS